MLTESKEYSNQVFSRLFEVTRSRNLEELSNVLKISASTLRSRKSRGSVPFEYIISNIDAKYFRYIFQEKSDESLKSYLAAYERVMNEKSRIENDTQPEIPRIQQTSKIVDKNIIRSTQYKSDDTFHKINYYEQYFYDLSQRRIIPADESQIVASSLFLSSYVKETLGTKPELLFGMKVKNDYLSPEVKKDDLVLIDQNENQFIDNKICAVRIDNIITLKRVFRLPGSKAYLRTNNSKGTPIEIYLNSPNFSLIGSVVHIQHQIS